MRSRPPILTKPFEAACKVLFSAYCRLDVQGQDRLPVGPFIICSNHESHMDSVALMTASGRPFNTFGLLAAKDYFFDHSLKHKFVSALLHLIPVSRNPAVDLLRSITIAREFLQHTNGTLILYPEGTRSQSGDIAPFKRGAGLFAAKLGVPVVPAWIHGGARSLPKGAVLPRPERITVRFGRPIVTEMDGSAYISRREFPRHLTTMMEQEVRALKRSEGQA
jgi:1-acyl-sn-glycerol-3-phosphate acyltransferase